MSSFHCVVVRTSFGPPSRYRRSTHRYKTTICRLPTKSASAGGRPPSRSISIPSWRVARSTRAPCRASGASVPHGSCTIRAGPTASPIAWRTYSVPPSAAARYPTTSVGCGRNTLPASHHGYVDSVCRCSHTGILNVQRLNSISPSPDLSRGDFTNFKRIPWAPAVPKVCRSVPGVGARCGARPPRIPTVTSNSIPSPAISSGYPFLELSDETTHGLTSGTSRVI
jgi:hypothetical protein